MRKEDCNYPLFFLCLKEKREEGFGLELTILSCHGSNNDFLIIDELEGERFSEHERAALAVLLCDRVSGIGADGLLFVLASHLYTAKMRVFNADGSEASMCGNGLRCVARYVCEKLELDEAVIETMKANLAVKKQPAIFGDIPTYQVEISPVSFQLSDLPLILEQDTLINEPIAELSDLSFTAVAVPNPHLIAIVSDDVLTSQIQEGLSRKVNSPNSYFPDGVNVSFVKVLAPGHIFVRTFERGVGFTNACGTAMSASTLVTCLLQANEWGEPVEVYNPGGKVRCVAHRKRDGQYMIDLIGNATFTSELTVEVDIRTSSYSTKSRRVFEKEINDYRALEQHANKFVSGS